jgi:hypothetical protein
MYCGSSARLGSLMMPLRLSVDLVVVDQPFQSRAVSEAIFVGLGGMPAPIEK